MDGEQALPVGPALHRFEPGARRQRLESGDVVFVGVFRMDGFAIGKGKFPGSEADGLRAFGGQVHFDAAFLFVEEGPVLESIRVNLGAQLGAHAVQ